MKVPPRSLIPMGLLLLAAGLLRYWMAPLATRLPADYASEMQLQVEDRFRASTALEWETNALTTRRVDQTLANSGEIAIIQGDLRVYTDSGQVIFESTGLYGVDRRTQQNVRGYGNADRAGQFLFPPHLAQTTYTYWDPMFIGPSVATFESAAIRDGLPVYTFLFSVSDVDETEGYSFMMEVPERFRAHTEGHGTLWVEPVAGVVVDYEEHGVSYFADTATGARLDDFHEWSGHFTPETKAAQLARARAARLRHLVLEDWLPLGLILLAVIWLAIGEGLRERVEARVA